MRIWEIVIIGALAMFVLWPSVTGLARRPLGWLPIVAAAAALLVHVRLEGPRWQMSLVYALVLIMAIATVWEILAPVVDDGAPPRRRTAQFGRALWGLLGLGVLAAPALILPIVEIEPPPLAVGTVVVRSVDDQRVEIYGQDPGGDRQIVLQIWYPAEPNDLPAAPFVDAFDQFAPVAADFLGLPSFALGHLDYSSMGAGLNAPLASSTVPYPVVVYSHGWGGFRTIAFTQAEELAANGYVVVAIDHTYGALGTTIDGGHGFAPIDPSALPELEEVGEAVYSQAAARLVDTFRDDIGFALDVMAGLNDGDPGLIDLEGRLDLGKVGVWGHSTGGGAAIEFCSIDERCTAVFGLDPWVEPIDGPLLVEGIPVPAAALRSQEWLEKPNEVPLAALWAASSKAEPLACISGTAHRDFTLLPRISPLASWIGMGGSLSAERSTELTEIRLLSFFDFHLKGEGTGQAGLSEPEITGCG